MSNLKAVILGQPPEACVAAVLPIASVEVCASLEAFEAAAGSRPFDILVDLLPDPAPRIETVRRRNPAAVVAVAPSAEAPAAASAADVRLPADVESWTSVLRLAVLAKAAARRAADLARRLEEADALAVMGRLVAHVLHELGNPVDAVRRYVRLAREAPDLGAAPSTHLEAAARGLDRMAEVLKGALAYARGSAVRETARPLAAVVDDCRVQAEDLRGKARFEIRLDSPEALVPSSTGQVLLNLLRNAYRSLRNGGVVRVSSRRLDARLLLEVEDDGAGFEPGAAERLFEPFFTTRKDGTGLGLAIARRLVEREGGRIRAESAGPGQGAVFTVELPFKAAAAGEASA